MSFGDAWRELEPIRGEVSISVGADFQRRRRLLDADPLGPIVIDGENYSPHDVTGYSVDARIYDLSGRLLLKLDAGPIPGLEAQGWIRVRATADETAKLSIPLDVGVRATDARIGILRWIVEDDTGAKVEIFRDSVTLEAE